MKITPSVYWLNGSAYSAVGNSETMGEAYGIETNEGMILIDCGRNPYGLDMINDNLKIFGVDKKITHCILTHAHHDHCGNARRLQAEGVKIIVGKEELEYCINGGPIETETPYCDEQSFPAFYPDELISEDKKETINGLEFDFIKTPGHTPGSMAIRVMIDNKFILFTGDILQPDGMLMDSINFGWKGDPRYSAEDIYLSIKKLNDYSVDIILPGHGKICMRNGNELLKYAAKKAYMINK